MFLNLNLTKNRVGLTSAIRKRLIWDKKINVCILYPFFNPLAQLIAEQFGTAEVNIKYFYIIIYQTYTLQQQTTAINWN